MNIFRSVSQKNTVLTISVSHGDTESFRSPLFLSLTLKPVCGDVSGSLTSGKDRLHTNTYSVLLGWCTGTDSAIVV